MGLFLFRCRTLQMPLLNFKRFHFAHLSSQLKSFWIAASSCRVSAFTPTLNHQQTCWEFLASPFIQIMRNKLNNTGPSTDPGDTANYSPPNWLCNSTHWDPLFRLLLIYLTIHFSNAHFLSYEDVVEDSVKALAEVLVDNIHCSSFIHPASCSITEGNQIG